ncbi:1167_t:CDS:2, partial [Acaulospora colombiana]
MYNVRDSWVSTIPPSIPEAESMNIQPTAVLEKNMPTAKSRLSIIIQKGSSRKTFNGGFIGSPTTINEVNDSENYVDLLSSQSLSSVRPISTVSSSTDSWHSVASSFTSVSIGTNNQDSMSDTTSIISTSPSYSHLIQHRHSIPSESDNVSSNDSHYDGETTRRSSMPSLSDHHNSEPNSTKVSISGVPHDLPTTVMEDANRKVEAKELEIALSRSRSSNRKNAPSLPVPSHNDIFNARVSKASLRMSLNTRMQKRLNIALEIINTERHYVECLLLVQRLFFDPLTESLSTGNPILSKKSISKIFANMPDLISINTELLRRLEERIAGPIGDDDEDDVEFDFWDPENGSIGDIFLDMAPFFKMYSIYVKNFNSALAVIDDQLRENPQFSEFFRNVIKTGQCKGLTLQAYLIMPVQRIPKYKMLLENLLRKTTETHPDYLNLKKAYQVIENVATFVNETIRQHEMFITMLEIQKSLAGFDEVLLIPGRRFIKRGTVKKICRRNLKQREFFLFSDVLIYASPSLMENMYMFHRKIDLEDVMVLGVEDNDNENEKNAFQILSSQKSFTVYADTSKDKESWINVIRETKDEYLSAKRTLKIGGHTRDISEGKGGGSNMSNSVLPQ